MVLMFFSFMISFFLLIDFSIFLFLSKYFLFLN